MNPVSLIEPGRNTPTDSPPLPADPRSDEPQALTLRARTPAAARAKTLVGWVIFMDFSRLQGLPDSGIPLRRASGGQMSSRLPPCKDRVTGIPLTLRALCWVRSHEKRG